MKYTLMIILLVLSAVVHSQDTLKHGSTSGPGDQGHGDSNYAGRNIMRDSLENRKLLYKGLVKDTCLEKGKIVLTVMVNRQGNVVNAAIGRGTTSTSKCLQEAAKAAALQSKFEKNEKAETLQAGKLVYYFSLQ